MRSGGGLSGAFGDAGEEISGGAGKGGKVTGILDAFVGESELLFDGPLGALAAVELGLVPAALGDALDAGLARCVDADGDVALGVDAGLEEKGHVGDDEAGAGGGGLADHSFAAVAHERVDEAFEAGAFGGLGEDDVPDFAAIDRALSVEDRGAPPRDERITDAGGVQGGAGLGVGIDDDGTEGGELGGEGRLAGADGAGEADDDGWRRLRAIAGGTNGGDCGLADGFGGVVGAADGLPPDGQAIGAGGFDADTAQTEDALDGAAEHDGALDFLEGDFDEGAREDT